MRQPDEIIAPDPPRALPALGTSKALIRSQCVALSIRGVVSFRAVPRILALLRESGIEVTWVPHFSSVIHWSLRVGLAKLRSVSPVETPWVALIDYSIDIGTKKALVILRVPLDRLHEKGRAIALSDCECLGVQIHERSNGDVVATALQSIFELSGAPQAILKDGGSDLNKGVSLWRERTNQKSVHVLEDLGHVAANALKAQFEKACSFVKLLDIVRKGASRLRQTSLAFQNPPKVRSKGRFQSLSGLGAWSQRMLEALSVKGRAAAGSDLDRLRRAFPGLASLRPFLKNFASTLTTVNEILSLLKQKGLNQKTYHECRALLNRLPACSKVRQRLSDWLKKHLSYHCRMGLGHIPLLVSSDIIESLFGKFKQIIERSPFADMNRTVLLIPVLCGGLDQNTITSLLDRTTHQDLRDWDQKNIPYTLRRKRRAFFKTGAPNTADQKTGNYAPDTG